MSSYAFNWSALPLFVTAVGCLAVGTWVLRREWPSRLAVSVFAGSAAMTVWLGAFAMMYLSADPATAFVWARAGHAAISLLPAIVYFYVAVGLRRYKSQKTFCWSLALIGCAFGGMSVGSGLLISGVEKYWWGYYPTYGPAGPVFVGYFALVVILVMLALQSRVREVPRGSWFHRRIKRTFLVVGIVCVAAVDFLAGFGLPVYPFGYVFVLAYLAMVLATEGRFRIVHMTPAVAAGEILATMQGAIVVTAPDGRIEVINRSTAELLGCPEADIPGILLDSVFASEAEGRSLLRDCLAGEKIRALETSWVTKDGRAVDVSISASLLTDSGDRPLGIVFAALDITSRKQAEQALREREEQLRQAQKLEAIGQLAGGFAHDFNNLLTAIIGNSSLALTTMDPKDPNRALVADIRAVGERAAVLTKQILGFARRQMLRPEAVSLNSVVLELEPLLRRNLGEDIELRISLAPDLRDSHIDPHQIRQVLLNLAANARDAMPNGGRLIIDTANASLGDTYCRKHREAVPGHYVKLAVSDNGAGMDTETQTRLFEPFFTTKAMGTGTGLGLAVVYGVVMQSGGSVAVYSEPGKGTTFKVYLPVAAASESVATEPVRDQEEGSPSTEHILVVEDEAPVRGLVTRVLSHAGYKVKAAGSLREAERVLDSEGYRPDLLLTDVVLPGGANGRQVADALLERFPGLRVVFMSGYTENAVVHNGRIDEGIAFLEKPFDPDALLRKVRDALDAGSEL
jgi:PAS domain S-box-containing protein